MKIFLVSNLYPSPKSPNFGTFVAAFANAMESMGGKIACKAVIDKKYKSKLMLLFAYLFLYIRIIVLGLSRKYDIIYVHYIAHTALPVLILSYLRKKTVVLNVHGDDILPRTKLVEYMQYLIKLLLRKSSLVVVPSVYFKDVFLDKFFFDEKKIYIYPSGGIDRTLFKKSDTLNRKVLGFKDDDIILGYVSRISKGKGWKLFIDAIRIVAQENKKIKGLIIGNGEEVKELKLYLAPETFSKNICFIENISHVELNKYYSVMTAFIFPTQLHESLGLVGLEAMSCGVPVIASDIGGIKTYMNDGYNGYLFSPENIEELVSKINFYLLLPKEMKEKMSKNCAKTAQEYDSNIVAQKLYSKLLSL